MRLFNAHIHAGPVPDAAKEYVLAGGMDACFCAYDIDSSFAVTTMASPGDGIYASVGIHPRYVAELGSDTVAMSVDVIESMLRNPGVKAIGEIGLDYRPERDAALDEQAKELQIAYFKKQLRLGLAYRLPIVIHCVRAHETCIAILESEGAFSEQRKSCFADGAPHVLMHGFSGSPEQLALFEKQGASFSFGPMILSGAESKVTRAAAAAAAESLMAETDEETDPARLVSVIDELARLRGLGMAEDLAGLVSDNARAFFLTEGNAAFADETAAETQSLVGYI